MADPIDKKKFMKTLSNELHKPVVRKFKRAKVITRGIDAVWAAPLVDMDFKSDNDIIGTY